ncbi:MAG: monooxygenase [Alphaproteobacteria bacterium]|nr:monooxygenase [Alphaproteobacteria bacterium]
MRVAVIGGGPAGLYFSYLFKRRRGDAEIWLVEQNPPDATFGFGVVFSDRALEFLRADDGETYDLIRPSLETWHDLRIVHDGEIIAIDGIGFSAIGRLELLRLLQSRVASVDLRPDFGRRIDSLDELADADLVIGADGVNSLVRGTYQDAFGASVTYFSNKFVWYGTTKPFETLTQTFHRTADGVFNAHHYRYAPGMSTFIVETDAETWARAGFAEMTEAETKSYCEETFAEDLDGHSLVSNKSVWRNFPRVSNRRWSAGNAVLVGDALHTAHFSIGSGTRLALEDAIALAEALEMHGDDVPRALESYEKERRPIVEKLVAAANASGAWYESFGRHMELDAWNLAWRYIQRSGRVDTERLRANSPGFVGEYLNRRSAKEISP